MHTLEKVAALIQMAADCIILLRAPSLPSSLNQKIVSLFLVKWKRNAELIPLKFYLQIDYK